MTDPVHHLAGRRIHVGTCSWTDKTLIDNTSFYPSTEMTAEERLAFYAERFPIVEVDSTYYAPPSEKVAGLWVERTGDFTFDVKAFRLLTQHPTPHASLWKDFRDELPDDVKGKKSVYMRDLPREMQAEAVQRFVDALRPLHSAGKLGLVLVQLPPYVQPSRGAFGYLNWLADQMSELDVAVEFRNGRWMDDENREYVLDFLEEKGLTYVCVDEPQGFRSSVPPVAAVTSRVAEVRFHGRNAETWEKKGITAAERFEYDYPADELAEWVPRVKTLAESAERVHLMMNNCYADYGIRSARRLADLLVEAGL